MKNRLTALTIASLLLLGVATCVLWLGCQSEINAPDPNQQMAAMLGGDPARVAAVMAVQNRHTDALMRIPGVVGTGTSLDAAGNPVIKVFAAGPITAGQVAARLDGVPVEIEQTGPFKALALTKQYRPVPIGVSVGNNNECAAGTIGCVVLKGSNKYILSNNHVLARENDAAIGEDIVQPGRYDTRCRASSKVADLSDFEPIVFSPTANNTMDAAIAQYSTTDVTCATLPDYYGFPGGTVVSPSVGLAIKKVGRTTSLTTGTITSVNVTVTVGYYSGSARYVGQFMTSKRISKSGDSGSLVVTNDANNNPVGLLFAGTNDGTSVCSPIGPILQRFAASICTQ
ncbi:MAG TPA: trypsin-like peptidase domain-containing protein [Candidatus Deferrimicrobium sp.]|nr:trypsin-like peptidase domain-containing protein [Candidatus Deferrimicrobium sp.]